MASASWADRNTPPDATLRTEAGKPMEVRQDNIADGSMFIDYIEWRAQNPSDDLMTALLNGMTLLAVSPESKFIARGVVRS